MELRARDSAGFTRTRPVTECGQCGEKLFMPEWSEFIDARRVRHLWACERCGYSFETTVRLATS
jgi:ribosomal protein S27AE